MVFWIILAILFLIIFFLRFWLFHISYFFFSYLENLFKFSESINPVVSWLVIGLLLGAIIGGIVVSEKYKLEKQYYLVPAVVLVVIMSLLSIVNKPLAAYAEHTNIMITGTTAISAKDSTNNEFVNRSIRHVVPAKHRKHRVKSSRSLVKDTIESQEVIKIDSSISKNRRKSDNGIKNGIITNN